MWNDDGDLITAESDLNISVGSDQYTFHLERLETSLLTDNDTCNSMSIDELWNTIQVSRLLPTSPFVHVQPKQDGTCLPRLLSDDSSKTLKYTNTHAKMSSLYQLTTSLPLQKAAKNWNRTHDRLDPTICERNNMISGRRLHVHSYTASNRIPWTYESYPSLSDTSHLPCHHPSQSTVPKKVDVEQLERDCDFNDSKSIIKCFKLYASRRPLLSEIAKFKTKGEKIQYVRHWRSMSREEQEQYKKVKKEESEVIKQQILNEKSRRDQELRALARRKKISITRKAKREMKNFMKMCALSLDDAICDIKTTPEKKTESNRQSESPVKKKQINNTSPPRQRTSSVIRVQSPSKTNKRKTTTVEDDERSMRRTKRSRLATGPDTIEKSHHKVTPRMVNKKSHTPNKKKVQGKLGGAKVKQSTTASNKQSPKRTIWRNSKSPQVKNESPRKITPRFITDQEGIQSLETPMVAYCQLGKRRKRDVKVHIKWASK